MHNKLHTLEEWTYNVAPKYPQSSRVLRKCARMRGPICGPFNSYCVGAGWCWRWVGKPIMVQRPGVWLLAACWCIVTRGRAQPSQQSREEMVRRLFYDKWACPLQLATNLREGLLLVESAYYCLHSQETMLNRGLNTVSICEIGTLQVKLQSSAKVRWELY